MNTILKYAFCLLSSCLFTQIGHAQAAEFTITPDPNGATVTEQLENSSIEKWTMTSGEVGANPMSFHILSEHSFHGVDYWFNTTVEMEFPENVRQQVYDNLTNAYYNEVKITDRGVSYEIISSTDLDIRTLHESEAVGELKFQPHDCTRVLGKCAFLRIKPDGTKEYLIRTSAFADGIWSDQLNYDPSLDPEGRESLLEKSRFSVDATGVTIDMEKKTYAGGKEYLTLLTRIQEQQEVETPSNKPVLPSGDYASIGISCTKPKVTIEVDDARRAIAAGKRALIRNSGSKPKIECGNETVLETSCPSLGYVLVSYKNDYTALACYKGSPPANPWAQE
jgi:hypothetical protein